MKGKRNQKLTLNSLVKVLFLYSLTFCLWLGAMEQIITAQTPDASQLVQQGITKYKAGDFQGAIAPWQTALSLYQKIHNNSNQAIVNENLARAYNQLGESEKALSHWQKVIAYYRTSGGLQLGRMLTEEAQTYSNLGQTEKAIALLCGQEQQPCLAGTAVQIAISAKDRSGEVAALGSLGEAYRLQGDYENAIQSLQQAQKIPESAYQFSLLNSLGNAYVGSGQQSSISADSATKLGFTDRATELQQSAENDYKNALQSFDSALQLAHSSNSKPDEMQILLNLIRLAYTSGTLHIVDQRKTEQAVQESLLLLNDLPASRNKVYAAISLANFPISTVNVTSSSTRCLTPRLPENQVKELLQSAVKTAQTLQDNRSQSFAFGSLGHFYECSQQYQQALELTEKALLAANQKLNAEDSLYLWEWQAGRILAAQGNKTEAIAAYQRGYNVLEDVRNQILIANNNKNLQFNFRDDVEPLYRNLAQLKLADLPSDTKQRERQLTETLTITDSLRLAQLQNYFGNDCVFTAIDNASVDELLGKDTAAFSSIFLEDSHSLAIILSLPNGEKKHKLIDGNQVIEEINKFRKGLLNTQLDFNYDTTDAQNLYNSIISPFENYLKDIKTLVFVQDDILGTVPMAALYNKNEQKYLVEKYAIAISPSLKLTAPKKLTHQEYKALILGITQPEEVDKKTYPVLPNIQPEINEIKKEFPNDKELVDQQFTQKKLEQTLHKTVYPIIHIATHAQFGIIPKDSFLIAGGNSKVTINGLQGILNQINGGSNSIELLTLSACQTALGDSRAALGLAGVALQAGVRSTLGSLWSVRDESTVYLISEFYNNLKSGKSKAQSLQAAQIKLIKAKENKEIDQQYDNPYYWAPFIMIGSWL